MKRSSIQNIIFCLVILAIAALFLFKPKSKGASATVNFPDGSQTIIDLTQDQRYDFESKGYGIHLVVEQESIRFVESECPDHLCEGFGRLSHSDEMATCLPAGVSVVVN